MDEKIIKYILSNPCEDFPMNQTLEEFYKKVEKWSEEESRYASIESNDK